MSELLGILTASGIECDESYRQGGITVIHAGVPALVISYGFLTLEWRVHALDAGADAVIERGRDLWEPLDRLARRSEAARVVIEALDRALAKVE